jgi:hypothetical protein
MGLVVGTNSWVSVAEADIYFADRWNTSSWAGLSNTQKEQLLITAYRWIQGSNLFSIAPSSTSEAVKQAQMELAWYIYNYMNETEKRRALYAQGVREFQLSKWEETLEESGFPDFIKDILADSLSGLGGYFPTASRDFDQGN